MRGRICNECLFEDVCAPAEKLFCDYLLGIDEMNIEYSCVGEDNRSEFLWVETVLTWHYDEYADGDWHWDKPEK